MSESSATQEPASDEPEEFLNRAARRAKGKKPGRSDGSSAAASQTHGREVVQNRRQQFGNRRTG